MPDPTNESENLSSTLKHYRKNIIGLILMAVCGFCVVSLFAYRLEDDAVIENVSLFEMFSEIGLIARAQVQNPLGFVGAKVSGLFILSFFGYTSIILITALGYVGLTLVRGYNYARAGYFFTYSSVATVLISTTFGFIENNQAGSMIAGRVGMMLASWLNVSIGVLGSYTITIGLMIGMILWILRRRRKAAKRNDDIEHELKKNDKKKNSENVEPKPNEQANEPFPKQSERAVEAESQTEDKYQKEVTTEWEPKLESQERSIYQPSFDVDFSSEKPNNDTNESSRFSEHSEKQEAKSFLSKTK